MEYSFLATPVNTAAEVKQVRGMCLCAHACILAGF